MTTPRTAAGRALWKWAADDKPVPPDDWYGTILAIEAEARAAALDEARAAVDSALWDLEGPDASHPGIRVEYRRRVMAAIDALRETAR